MRQLLVLALCIASAVAVGKRCKTNDECEEDECCVNYVLTPIFGGHCQPTRKEGESCTPLEKKNDEKPNMYHFQCPCKAGLECVAQHEIEIFGHVVKHRPECVVQEMMAMVMVMVMILENPMLNKMHTPF